MIKVFTGPMYSDKSNSLIEEYKKIWDKSRVLCFKPSKDTREFSKIHSRNNALDIPCIVIKDLSEIAYHIQENTSAIFIDEIQFLTGNPELLLLYSIDRDIDIYVAGLSLTSEQTPFGIMPEVLAYADEVVHLQACCSDCNKHNATLTYCLEEKTGDILVGSSMYVPLCAPCLVKRKTLRR